MLHPTIFNTSQICYQFGTRHAVMSPGSRNAPLTISFARNKEIKKWVIPDERSAGFIALGIAQQTKEPVVLCCTSGTALLNYAPAIAEAYYREIPLIVLSADRPPELIDQRDGQTIRQFEVLGNHVRSSVQLPVVSDPDFAKRYQADLIKAIAYSLDLPHGPVHINVPFKEPFYPAPDQSLAFEPVPYTKTQVRSEQTAKKWPDISAYKKILVLVGQHPKDAGLNRTLEQLAHKVSIIRSPLNNLRVGINHTDLFVRDQLRLKPDLLITSGLSILSKNLKIFLRKYAPKHHLHFDPAGVHVDTFQTRPKLVNATLEAFLLSQPEIEADLTYIHTWDELTRKTNDALKAYFDTAKFSESAASWHLIRSVPSESVLHLGNSMPVRFADIFGVHKGVETWCNRGTSGIDGCTSTAIGTTLVSEKCNVLFTGDLSFLYDRNAFFHNYKVPDLRIIVLNNAGGGIFRLIEGSANLPELKTYFEASHNKTARYICAENKIEYLTATSLGEINSAMHDFYAPALRPKLLEVVTDPEVNQQSFNELKRYIHEQIKF